MLIMLASSIWTWVLFSFNSGSGLSSSAAFVCSSTIAIMAVFGQNFEKVLLSHALMKEASLVDCSLGQVLLSVSFVFRKNLHSLQVNVNSTLGHNLVGWIRWLTTITAPRIISVSALLNSNYCNRQSLLWLNLVLPSLLTSTQYVQLMWNSLIVEVL